jgi:hypothetical protein
MKKTSLLSFALMMIAAVAFAQHHGGPGPGPEHGPGGPGEFGGPGGPGADASVGSDGSIYLAKVTETSNDVYTTTITAIRPAGTVAWTATVNAAAHIVVSGANVIAESGARNSDGTFTTTLNAFSASTGAAAWTVTLNGRARLIPFSGGTYAIVTVPATTSGGSATRSLIGISNSGSTLFTLAL